MMLSEPGLWLIIAGVLLVTFGFFGFAFSQNRHGFDGASGEQLASTPIDLPKAFGKKGADNRREGVCGVEKQIVDQLPRRPA